MRLPSSRVVDTPRPRKFGKADAVFPHYHNPVQWRQAMDYARQACARIFRDGGKPSDALAAFGLTSPEPSVDWSVVVDRIAELLCAPRLSKAAGDQGSSSVSQ